MVEQFVNGGYSDRTLRSALFANYPLGVSRLQWAKHILFRLCLVSFKVPVVLQELHENVGGSKQVYSTSGDRDSKRPTLSIYT